MSLCLYCHSRLGGQARQCLACGWHWHNPNEPTHSGFIHWERFGLETEGDVVIDLCEAENGERYFEYRLAGSPIENWDFVIETESTTIPDLQRWRFIGLETHLRLSDGSPFWFDERGYWQTSSIATRIGFIDRSWVGSTDGLLTKESAILNAVAYGKRLRIAPFHVEYAKLLNERGRPIWTVPLYFDDDDPPFCCVFVHVDATSGEATHIENL
jgi:hypothetical protein